MGQDDPTRNKKKLGAPGSATRSKEATSISWPARQVSFEAMQSVLRQVDATWPQGPELGPMEAVLFVYPLKRFAIDVLPL